ncbi:hypothetical protein Ciccas_008539 [Cichlidogyrus casuarinus]|uniref:Uncharacterized protein n=1 Tax=Cichlidogyrus casuarinus TaxID=1844966 RepID=A0ABD2Q170_9PLAT
MSSISTPDYDMSEGFGALASLEEMQLSMTEEDLENNRRMRVALEDRESIGECDIIDSENEASTTESESSSKKNSKIPRFIKRPEIALTTSQIEPKEKKKVHFAFQEPKTAAIDNSVHVRSLFLISHHL